MRCGQGVVRMKDDEEERSIDNLNLQLKSAHTCIHLLTPLTSPPHKSHRLANARQRSPSSPPWLPLSKARHILHPPQPRADGTQGFGHESRRSSYGLGQEHGRHAGTINPCARPPARYVPSSLPPSPPSSRSALPPSLPSGSPLSPSHPALHSLSLSFKK